MYELPKLLIVEDDPANRRLMEEALAGEGFALRFHDEGLRAIEIVLAVRPALILLDINLPGLSGLEVCRRLKGSVATRGIPTIMVTGRGEEGDTVLGLGMGADDYVLKPFRPRELAARVHAVLRRASGPGKGAGGAALEPSPPPPPRLLEEDIRLDLARMELQVGKRRVDLSPPDLRLLHLLASHPGRVFTRDELVRCVLDPQGAILERNIDVRVRAIRAALGPRRGVIETVRGVGYRYRDSRSQGGEFADGP